MRKTLRSPGGYKIQLTWRTRYMPSHYWPEGSKGVIQ